MPIRKEEEIFKLILQKRGLINDKKVAAFIRPKYADLHNPWLLPDMERAVDRIVSAWKNKEQVYIYGDYDVDGLSATALLLDAFKKFGINAESYIPDRFTEGYGMSKAGIRAIASSGAKLIVTVDCGSKSIEEVALAKKLGLDVIITDHHTLGNKLPKATALINPKRSDSKYPFKDLAGVGVAFKLVLALQEKLQGMPIGQEKWLLDLVALGTTCDIVSLTDENRAIVHWGIEVAKKGRRPGIRSLARVSNVEMDKIDTSIFGFRFGPRLNAVGRLETAAAGLELLSSSDDEIAQRAADSLDVLNSKRRAIQQEIYKGAATEASKSHDNVLVLADKNWSHGVVGIVASKIVEQFKKPTFIVQILGDEAKGSARSFGDFHLAHALSVVKNLVIKGGGHALAAGVTLETKNIPAFRKAVNEYYESLRLSDQTKYLSPATDVQLDSFDGLNEQLVKLITQLEPFGKDNEKPIFEVAATIDNWRPVGRDNKHAKVQLSDTQGNKLDAIAFNLVPAMPDFGTQMNILFELDINEFNGSRKVQANIIDLH